tara:strand:- start:49 stop:186 length:138 start_codon:yes stop_codon:yes gene_type:complete
MNNFFIKSFYLLMGNKSKYDNSKVDKMVDRKEIEVKSEEISLSSD